MKLLREGHLVNHQTTPDHGSATPTATAETPGLFNHALLDLLAKWRAEGVTDDPVEIRRGERELAEFMDALNKNRLDAGDLPLVP